MSSVFITFGEYIMDTPGRRLQMLRKAKGLTQTALATAVGLKPTIVSRLENDDVEPSIGSAERISVARKSHTAEGEEAAILIDGVPNRCHATTLAIGEKIPQLL